MKNKKIPLRSCIVTKEKLPKQKLLRVVKNNKGIVFVDETGKANGRGVYLKKDIDVIEEAKKRKYLEKHLQVNIKDSIYEDLAAILNN